MSLIVKVKNGTLDLLTSGVFILKGSEQSSIFLKDDNEEISLILKFQNTEKDTDKINKVATVINNNTLEITFSNYNNSLGNYTKDMWPIGTFKGRRLLLSYGIFGMTDGSLKKFDYSFYLGEEVQNG
jgi:hypothetical protein